MYLKDVQDVIFNFIKNNFAPTTLLLYKNAIRNFDSNFYRMHRSFDIIQVSNLNSYRYIGEIKFAFPDCIENLL